MLNKLNKIVLPFFILFSFNTFSYADEYDLEKIIGDLYKPWGMSFIDDENLLNNLNKLWTLLLISALISSPNLTEIKQSLVDSIIGKSSCISR